MDWGWGQRYEKLKLDYLLCSFHFRSFASVCFNKNLTECSRVPKESRLGMSHPRSVSHRSVNAQLGLKSVVTESNGSVRHRQAPNKDRTSGRTKVISALMDVSQWGNVAVQHLSVVKGFPCSACHIHLYSSSLFFSPFGSPLLLTLKKAWCQAEKITSEATKTLFLFRRTRLFVTARPLLHAENLCPASGWSPGSPADILIQSASNRRKGSHPSYRAQLRWPSCCDFYVFTWEGGVYCGNCAPLLAAHLATGEKELLRGLIYLSSLEKSWNDSLTNIMRAPRWVLFPPPSWAAPAWVQKHLECLHVDAHGRACVWAETQCTWTEKLRVLRALFSWLFVMLCNVIKNRPYADLCLIHSMFHISNAPWFSYSPKGSILWFIHLFYIISTTNTVRFDIRDMV